MHDNLLLDDLVESVLQEIGKFGLDPITINHYRQTYRRLKQYAAARNVERFCDSLIQSFLHDLEEQHKAGANRTWQTKPSQTSIVDTARIRRQRSNQVDHVHIRLPADAQVERIGAPA